jgi:L-threonylcarbamoyladenylate synthase
MALRVPASPWLRELIDGLRQPLVSTSVNREGKPARWRVADIVAEFGSDVDLVLDGGDLPDAEPSTIVDAASRPFKLLRQGALRVPPEDLG